jgi:Zn-dependent protease
MDLTLLITIPILILSIILHEVSHGYMADLLGDPTARLEGRLTLNPVPHIDPMGSIILPLLLAFSHSPVLLGWAKPVPYNRYNLRDQRWGEALIAAAGPGANLLIALIFGLLVRAQELLPLSPTFVSLAVAVIYINVLLALFNLVPIPPLDGSKVFGALLPKVLRDRLDGAQDTASGYGFMVSILLIMLFVYFLSPYLAALVEWAVLLIAGSGIYG